MAIDLPPGNQPALAHNYEVQYYRNSAQDASTPAIYSKLSGYEVIVLGNTQLDPETVRNALTKANNLSDGIWQLHFAYMQAGRRLTRLRYLLEGTQLYILVIEGYLAEIKAPAPLKKYFWELEGRRFDLPDLEARRTLANLQAGRIGLNTQSQYEPVTETSKAVRLSVKSQDDPEHRPVSYTLEVGNPGNRFVGRYFALGEATLNTRTAQWKLNISHSLNDSDSSSPRRGDLEGYQLSANSIVPIGLLGGAVGKTDYRFTNGPSNNEFDGDITQAQFFAQQIAYADTHRRSLLSQRLIFIDSEISSAGTGETRLNERYFAAELGLEQTRRMLLFDLESTLKLEARLRKGLSDNSGTLGVEVVGVERDARFLLFRPGARIDFDLSEDWQLTVEAHSQFADRQVPEQQQWLLGGSKRLRAWLPGALIGDTGHFLAVELQGPAYKPGNMQLQPTAFIEAGTSRLKASNQDLSAQQRGYDAGMALDIRYGPHWQLSLVAAEPFGSSSLNTAFARTEEADVFFNLKYEW